MRQDPALNPSLFPRLPWLYAQGRRVGRRLRMLFFVSYVATALLWLLLGLAPIAVHLFQPIQDILLARLHAIGYTFSPEGMLLRGINLASYTTTPLAIIAVQYLFSVANIGLGIVLVWLRPGNRVAWLLALGLIGTGAIFNAQSHVVLDLTSPQLLTLLHETLHIFSGVSYAMALLLFPTGTLPPSPFPDLHLPRWLDWPFRIALLLSVGIFGWTMLGALHGDPASFVAFFGFLVPIIGGLAQLFRYRRAMAEPERQQTRTLLLTLLLGLGMALAANLLFASDLGLIQQAGSAQIAFIVFPLLFTGIPVALSFIVLRYRLWELNFVINRSLIYGTLTALIALFYGMIVGSVDMLLQARWHWVASALTVGAVAILVQPLRAAVQGGVNRLMYGDRDDPVAAISRLGQRLESAAHAEDVLPAIAETVARALKLPYVAIAVSQDDDFIIVATHGEAATEAIDTFPLIDQGEMVGKLLVAHRSFGEAFLPSDRRLLANLARQAGPAVHAVLLAEALQRSRLRLVTAAKKSAVACAAISTTGWGHNWPG